MSPSGRYVAYVQTGTDKVCLDKYGQINLKKQSCKDKDKVYRSDYAVGVYDLELEKIVTAAPLPKNYYVSWLEFANEDKLLVSLGSRTTMGKSGRSYSLGSSRVISMDVTKSEDSTEPVVLFADQKNLLKANRRLTSVSNFLRDDPDHVIMPARKDGDLDLWKVNVNNGQATRVATGKDGTFFWYTNRSGEPVFRYDCSSRCRKIKIYVPGEESGSWVKIREFKTKPDDDLEDYQFYPVALTDNENQIYVKSLDDDEARHSIKIYDIETKSYVRTVYQHPTMDVGGVMLSRGTGDYMGVWFYKDRLTYDLTDKRLQKHYDALNKYFDSEYNVRLLGFNSAGTKAVAYVWGHDYPGSYYIYDFEARNIDKLISTEPELESKLSSDGRIINIPMRDGKSITAYHYYPKGKQAGAPLIVMPHGGPHSRDKFTFDYNAQYLVARGYQVVQMNFRGSSGYGRAFEEAGFGEWGGLMQDDITDTTKYFHSSGLATPDKTCIFGYSFGGYAALFGGATTPELYKCIVAGGAPSDLIRMMKDDKGNFNEEAYDHMKDTIGDPKTEKDKIIARSPIHKADQFVAPVLLVHGEYDGRIDISHAKKMEKALNKAGKPVQLLELKNEGHGGWDLKNDILYLETVETFLRQHIGP